MSSSRRQLGQNDQMVYTKFTYRLDNALTFLRDLNYQQKIN